MDVAPFSGDDSTAVPSLIDGGAASIGQQQQATVIPSHDTMIADLLNLELTPQQPVGGPMAGQPPSQPFGAGGLDDLLGLGGGSDGLV